ncbi:hypothetical protein C4J94_1986 [Pseudomonas sp. R5-89-07]|nr:hypothetical protein C4J94_1986 [Pseudomonas sp. R5-89-07]
MVYGAAKITIKSEIKSGPLQSCVDTYGHRRRASFYSLIKFFRIDKRKGPVFVEPGLFHVAL